MKRTANAVVILFALAMLMMGYAVKVSLDTQAEVRTLLLNGQTPAARTAKRAAEKAVVFDTYTHGILCSSLVVNRTELKHQPTLLATVDQMLKDYCPGFTLP